MMPPHTYECSQNVILNIIQFDLRILSESECSENRMKIVFTPALMSLRSSAEAGVTTEAGSDSGYTTSTERLSLT